MKKVKNLLGLLMRMDEMCCLAFTVSSEQSSVQRETMDMDGLFFY